VGEVDYLVLLGDIIDFSVASYEDAYKHAKVFFRKIQEDTLARRLIYIPGNHDFDIWHTVEYQVNIINQLKQGQLPRAFKRTVPGLIDDRLPKSSERFRLPDVPPRPEWHEDDEEYGNLFLDHITRANRTQGRKLNFSFAYPNLYLITDQGESVLLTHGHYLERYWSFAAEWVTEVARDDLELELDGELNLREMVGINLPLSHLACTGVGQAQPLTHVMRKVQTEILTGKTDSLAKYIGRIESMAGKLKLPWAAKVLRAFLFRFLRGHFLEYLRTMEQARYSRQFLKLPSVRNRFRNYYRTSLNEIQRLHLQYGTDIPDPLNVVFGHTHQPIPWGSDELMTRVNGKVVRLSNTGGWLLREEEGTTDFVGAEVILYETGQGVRSVSIRTDDLQSEAFQDRQERHPMNTEQDNVEEGEPALVLDT
jgi:UDP-2,3-diacylglucosamine pyrophosphatase LpxH